MPVTFINAQAVCPNDEPLEYETTTVNCGYDKKETRSASLQNLS